jgi:hypothetical protein
MSDESNRDADLYALLSDLAEDAASPSAEGRHLVRTRNGRVFETHHPIAFEYLKKGFFRGRMPERPAFRQFLRCVPALFDLPARALLPKIANSTCDQWQRYVTTSSTKKKFASPACTRSTAKPQSTDIRRVSSLRRNCMPSPESQMKICVTHNRPQPPTNPVPVLRAPAVQTRLQTKICVTPTIHRPPPQPLQLT